MILDLLALAAATLAVPQLLPQLRRVRRLGHAGGVSPTWAVLTAVNNLGWLTYFTSTGLRTGIVPAASVVVLASTIVVALGRIGVPLARAVRVGGAWGGLLGTSLAAGGPELLGLVLGGAFVVQVTPSLVTAHAATDRRGISRVTWLLIGAEVACWGTIGVLDGRPPLMLLGAFGLTAATTMLWLTRPVRPAGLGLAT